MWTIKNVSGTGPTTTYQRTKDGLKVPAGGTTLDIKFDGRDYPVPGEPDHTVSLKGINSDTIEQTEKQDGEVFRIIRMTVSKDGKSMNVVDTDKRTDKQRGGTMTYTAEKRPLAMQIASRRLLEGMKPGFASSYRFFLVHSSICFRAWFRFSSELATLKRK